MKFTALTRLVGAVGVGVLVFAGAPALSAQTAAELNSSGLAKTKEGNLAGAVDDFSAAIAQKPDPSFYANRAFAETGQGNYDGAINDYGELIKAKPSQANGYLLRGLANFLKGDMDSSMKDYSKAIELQPKSPTLLLYRGIAWDCMNNQQGAVEDFSKAIQLAGSDSEDANYAALYRALDLKRKGPDADLELGDTTNWKSAWTKTLAAYVGGKLPEPDFFQKAANDGDDDRAKNHQKAEANYFAGRVHELAGEKPEARKDFNASVDLQGQGDVERRLARVELDRMGPN